MRSWSKDIGKWLVHRFVTRDIGKCRVRESDHHCGDRGDMVGATLRMVDPNVAFSAVRASRGKMVRAEPVAALYQPCRAWCATGAWGQSPKGAEA